MPVDFSVADLSKALETATDDFKRTVSGLIEAAPFALQGRLQSAYPVGKTGTLRRRIAISSGPSRPTTTAVQMPTRRVRATAPHVNIWQVGTGERFDATRANARRGRMPAGGQVFERNAAEVRRAMLNQAQQEMNRNKEII